MSLVRTGETGLAFWRRSGGFEMRDFIEAYERKNQKQLGVF